MSESRQPQPVVSSTPVCPPFKFFAIANDLIAEGELVEFSVNATGKVTSPKLDFVYKTPPLTRSRACER